MTLHRRRLLQTAGLALAGGIAAPALAGPQDRFANSPFRKLSDADWKKRLSPESYRVLRQAGTEWSFSSPLDHVFKKGTYACAGCGLPLFRSDWKYDSGTGWPSFTYSSPTSTIGCRARITSWSLANKAAASLTVRFSTSATLSSR